MLHVTEGSVVPPLERMRTIGEYRLSLTQCTAFRENRYIPVPWQLVRLTDVNGAPVWSGVVPDDDVVLEVLTHIENYRQFLAALLSAENDA